MSVFSIFCSTGSAGQIRVNATEDRMTGRSGVTDKSGSLLSGGAKTTLLCDVATTTLLREVCDNS